MGVNTGYVVLGAGVSGLAVANHLQSHGKQTVLIESAPTAGGLTRTVNIDNFCYDYSGHLLHLSKYELPSSIPYANLKDNTWQRIDKNAVCYLGGEFIPTPVQYNMGYLPRPLLGECTDSYYRRPSISDNNDPTFRDFIVSGFGETLSDVFLIPQNEKTLSVSLDHLSQKAVRRFFPHPDDNLIRAGIEKLNKDKKEYNSLFWYPKKGGIQLLVDGFAKNIKNLNLLEEIIFIDLVNHIAKSINGTKYVWDILISSIPLKRFCEICNDKELNQYAKKLTCGSTVIFNIGAKNRLNAHLKGIHWIYVPDRSLPFYRVGIYSNMSNGVCPVNYHSFYIEVGIPYDEIDTVNVVDLYNDSIKSLENLKWINSADIISSCTQIIKYSYVHHTPQRDDILDKIKTKLETYGVFLTGRYGTWDYISMEDAIFSSIEIADKLI